MTQPGDTVKQQFEVRLADGTAVTGLTTGSFTFKAYADGATATWSVTVTEIGLGGYSISYTLGSTTTSFDRFITPVSALNFIHYPDISGEIEGADLDSIAASVVRPTAVTDGNFGPANELTFSYVTGDSRPISFSVVDSAGSPIDLTDYSSFGFGIRTQDGTSSVDQITAVTGSAGGVVEVTILVTDNFQSELAAGEDSLAMKWDFQATLTATSDIYTLAHGTFFIQRHEFQS